MPDSAESQRLDVICHYIATGRNFARQLALVVRTFQLSEAEFRILWLLNCQSSVEQSDGWEQCAISRELAISPSQVSAIVEKLRLGNWLHSKVDSTDRRRQRWQLTSEGRERLQSIIPIVERQSRRWDSSLLIDDCLRSRLGDAA